MSVIERLVRDLRDSGTTATPSPDGGGLQIEAFHGRRLEPAVDLAFSGAELVAHLEANAADAAAVYPDTDAVTAAYRLFLVHLDEAVITRAVPGSRITLEQGGLRVDPRRPADPLPHLDPDATYVWASEPPDRRRRSRGD